MPDPFPIACPECGQTVHSGPRVNGGAPAGYRCERHGAFPTVDGVPCLLPRREAPRAHRIGSEFVQWRSAAGPMHPRQRRRVHRRLVQLAGPGRGRFACDVGAANSPLSKMLAHAGWDVVALDLVPELLPQDSETPRLRSVLGVMEAPPVAHGSLDLALMCSVLQYAQDPASVLEEWHRRLAPQGRLFIALTPVHRSAGGSESAQATARRLISQAGRTEHLAQTYRHYVADDIASALEQACFQFTVHPAPFTVGFRAWRSLKNTALGGDLARFPIYECTPIR